MSHHCVPYAVAPLLLFEELRRVLKPGTLCLTFQGPPPQDPRSGGDKSRAFHAAADPRSASSRGCRQPTAPTCYTWWRASSSTRAVGSSR